MSVYFSHWISTFFTFLVCKIRSLRNCALYIYNNANLHKTSNNRLSLLNTMSLTFIIFAACLLKLQANTLYANIQLSIPSDLLVSSSSTLDEINLSNYLSREDNRQSIQRFVFLTKYPPTPSMSQTLTTYANYAHTSPTISFIDNHYLEMM